MSWVAIEPVARPSAKRDDAIVTISVSKSGNQVQRVYLIVRPALLPEGALPWWTYGKRVKVERGEGEHAGRLRLTDNGLLRIMSAVNRNKDRPNPPCLQIASVPGMPAEGMVRRPVLWEIAGEALIVTLPWSGAKGAAQIAPRIVGTASSALPVPPTPASPTPAPAAPKPVAAPAALPVKPQPPVAPAKPLATIERSYAEIQAWAIQHGVGSATHGFDLAAVNALRVKRGEHPLKIRTSAHGRQA